MPLYTFLEKYDFSNKVIIPFNTHGGSDLSNTIQTIESLQHKASVIKQGFMILRENAVESKKRLSIGYKR